MLWSRLAVGGGRGVRAAAAAARPRCRRAASRALSAPAAREEPEFQLIVGLEVHAQIAAASKLFSAASTSFASPPNSAVSLVDMAAPGTLPVLNARTVRQAALLGMALGGEVQRLSRFERKHYFYVDMPQGYQITQQDAPIVVGGTLQLAAETAAAAGGGGEGARSVRVTRIQLEQDSGKNVHDLHPRRTYVDLNRAGSALVEVVTEPDMRSAEEAASFVRRLQALVRYLGVCSGNMEDGSLRCDVNVSVAQRGVPGLGERVEVKNLNSLRSLVGAVQHEHARQVELLRRGEPVLRETRGFDSRAGVTVHQRSKEDMLDYRFLPEPDLPPLRLDEEWLRGVRESIPELPDEVCARWQRDLGLSAYDAGVLVAEPGGPAFFDAMTAAEGRRAAAKRCVNWLANELLGRLASAGEYGGPLPLGDSPVGPDRLGALVDLVEGGAVSGKHAKELLDAMMEGDARGPAELAAELGFAMDSDAATLAAAADRVMEAHPKELAKYLKKVRQERPPRGIVGFLVGRVIAETRGQGNPKMASALVAERLARLREENGL